MMNTISQFTTTMICTMMVLLIVKMIVPDGKNKKYIFFVCSIITTITLLEPLLEFMKMDISEVFASNETQYNNAKMDESLYQNAIKKSYEEELVKDITTRLNENGYSVSNVKVEYDNQFRPTKVYMQLQDKSGYIQPIKIEVMQNNNTQTVSELTKKQIKSMIHSYYGIANENIIIEGGK